MGSYGSVLAIYLIPTIGAFLLGLLFWGKLKTIRYILWGFSVIFFILIISIVFKHSDHNKEESENHTGYYKIDLRKSKCQNDSLSKFADLILIVKDDNTFKFSRQTVLFPSISGTWDFKDNGDLAFTECQFDNTNNHFQVFDGADSWTFQSDCLTDGKTGDLIVFSKKK